MRRAAVMLVAIIIAVAACGDDDAEQPSPPDAGATTTAGITTTDATPSSPEAPASTITTAAPPTTTTAGETTTTATALSGPDAFVAAAVDFVGAYEGTWNNTTFGSTGSISIEVLEVNTGAGFVLVEIDLGGNVFGGEDPDPFVIEIFKDGGGLTVGFSTFFASSTFEIDEAGHFTLIAGVAGLQAPLVIEGDVFEDGLGGTYSVEGLAEGTWTAAFIG